MRTAIAFLITTVLLAVGCGSDDESSAPAAPQPTPQPTARARFESKPCPTPAPSGLVDGTNVRCGNLVVPEDRSVEGGRTISLFVTIVRPPSAPKEDPIVHLIGGPGGSTEAYATVLGADFGLGTATRTGREMILFDQRGAGRSTPSLACKPTESPKVCLERLGREVDLAAYNSEESAADVEDLRVALGYAKINLYGQSYGTVLAQTVMRRFPAGVRSVVLESVSSVPHDAHFTNSAKALEFALGRVFAECAADTTCKAAFPDPAGDLAQVLARYEGNQAELRAFVGQLVTLTQFAQGTSYVPLALRARATDDAVGITGLAKVLAGYDAIFANSERGFSLGTFIAMDCYDYGPLWTPARDEAVNGTAPPAFRAALADSMASACALLPKGRVSEAQRAPFTSEIPTLLIGGAHDSNTPVETIDALAPSLARSQKVTVPGWGHAILSLGEPCSAKIFAAFVEDPAQTPDTTCLKTTAFPTEVP